MGSAVVSRHGLVINRSRVMALVPHCEYVFTSGAIFIAFIALLNKSSDSELRGDTCHMGSHSVTCHPTQVIAPRLTPARQAGTRCSIQPTPEGWKAEFT